MRLQNSTNTEAKNFAQYLLKIGNGIENGIITTSGTDFIEIPDYLCIKDNNLDSLIEFVYPNINCNYTNANYFTDKAILASKNKTVSMINNYILSKITHETEKTYYSSDRSKIDESDSTYPIEYLNSYESNNLPSHELKLKINSVVICLRNLRLDEGNSD